MTYDFKMSGGLGDIVYALPAIRALGGGSLCICPSEFTDNELHSRNAAAPPEIFESLASFLVLATGYLTHVDISRSEEEAKCDLNKFRDRTDLAGPKNLAQQILEMVGADPQAWRLRWLDVPASPFGQMKAVVNRTPRYHAPNFPWRAIVDKYSPDVVFVGSLEEQAIFCDEAGYVPWRSTRTISELAEQIAGSKLFCGNQSLAYALAEGMKHPAILEESLDFPNCNFERAEVLRNPTVDQLPDLS